jgi:DinB superfamily
MHPLLEQLKHNLDLAIEGMSDEHFTWHPALKWSTAEVLEHLYLSYTGTTRGFERVMESGKPSATRGSLRQHVRALVVFGFDYLPSGREAPAATRPKGLPPEKVRNGFLEKLVAMDSIIAQCEARLGSRTRLLDHPFLGPLTAGQWRKFHLLHGMHHQKQILRLREAASSTAPT